MASATVNPNLAIFSLFIIIFFLSSIPAKSESSVYDILTQFGLPKGLLPDCVVDYTFSPEDGNFVVELEKPCYVQFDYLVYYEKRITGSLKMGSITNLKGIQVKRLFLWFDVDEIKVDLPPSDSIYFQVGLINKKLKVDQFQSVRSCNSGVRSFRSWKLIFELPPPVENEIQMLLTE